MTRLATKWGIAIAATGLVAVVALVVYQYLQAASQTSLLDPDDQDLVALGETVYAEYCASCHGTKLEGQPDWQQRRANGRLPAPPHDESGHTWHHPDEQLFQLTKLGPAALVGGGYQSDMPGFGSTLSDEEIRASLSYIKSTWPPVIRERHDQINRRTR